MLVISDEEKSIIAKYNEIKPLYDAIIQAAKMSVIEGEIPVEEVVLPDGSYAVFKKKDAYISHRFDTKAFKAEYPDLSELFTKENLIEATCSLEFRIPQTEGQN